MKVQSIKVTRTINYSPDTYLQFCEESGEQPTQDGFLKFIEDWIYEDFRNEFGEQTIELLNND